MSSVAALVLAADRGPGFDRPKPLVDVGGIPLLQRVLSDVASWPVDEVVVVLGADAEEVLGGVGLGDSLVVIDPEWEEGTAASLRAGIDVLARGDAATALLARGDQPGIDSSIVEQMLAAQRQSEARAVVPRYRYSLGWPIAVSEYLWPRLMGLEGESDVLHLLQSHPEWLEEVWIDSLAPRRVLTRDDL